MFPPYLLCSHIKLQCHSRWRNALLNVGPKWQLVSMFFQQVFACVDIAHILTLWRQSWSHVGLQRLWQAGWGRVTLVYLAMVVLIGLVNRIFHKRSDGLEQFLFGARKGMCLFHSLKGGFCAAQLQQPNSFFCLPALFVSVFIVWMHLVPRPLVLPFVFAFHTCSL